MESLLQNPTFLWSLALVIGVPLIVIFLGELIERLRMKESEYIAAFEILRNVFLPLLTASVIVTAVLKMSGENLWWRLILTAFCFAIAYTLLSFVAAVQSHNNSEGRWEARVPTIIKTVTRAFAIIVPFALLVAVVWNLDLTKYIAAIGVGSIAIAFALQNTLSSVISGILLALDKPFKEGDWIEVNGNTGRVIDLNWRTTRLAVNGRDIIVIPNTMLLDSELKNFTAFDKGYRDSISFGFAYSDLPNTVKDVMLQVAKDCPAVSEHPPAEVHTISYDDSSIGYQMHFHCDVYISAFQARRTRDDLMTRLYYAAAREGLEIPYPIRTLRKTGEGDLSRSDITKIAKTALCENSLTSIGSSAVLDKLAQEAKISHFGRGTRISQIGEYEKGIYLILTGAVKISDRTGREVKILGKGELFGARLLVGQRVNRQTTYAVQDSELLLFPIKAVDFAMGQDAGLARSLHNYADELLLSLDNTADSNAARIT